MRGSRTCFYSWAESAVPDDLAFFSLQCKPLLNCSVFCVFSPKNLTYEIILTLGQAFEVAYQLALQAQRAKPLGAGAGEAIETKSSKPVPKPRAGMRKSAVSARGQGGSACTQLGFPLGLNTRLNLSLGGEGSPGTDKVLVAADRVPLGADRTPIAVDTTDIAVSTALVAVLLQC